MLHTILVERPLFMTHVDSRPMDLLNTGLLRPGCVVLETTGYRQLVVIVNSNDIQDCLYTLYGPGVAMVIGAQMGSIS
jgi:hypothetical protein